MRRAWLLTLVLACAMSGCASDSEPEPVATPTVSDTPTETAEPTDLAFGRAQTVAWTPTPDLAGELSISVDSVREGDFADFDGLVGSGISRDNQPFYVDAELANEGEEDLGGLDVPLYLVDSNGTLSPPWGFAEPFRPCSSGPLPESFEAGDDARMCLVFFGSPGATFESITFQPTLETPAVRWSGEVAVEKKATKKSR